MFAAHRPAYSEVLWSVWYRRFNKRHEGDTWSTLALLPLSQWFQPTWWSRQTLSHSFSLTSDNLSDSDCLSKFHWHTCFLSEFQQKLTDKLEWWNYWLKRWFYECNICTDEQTEGQNSGCRIYYTLVILVVVQVYFWPHSIVKWVIC